MDNLSLAQLQLHNPDAHAASQQSQQSIDISAAIVDQSNVGIFVI